MDQGLTIAIIAGLGGMLGWGFADFFAKKTIDKVGDIPSLVWAHSIASIFLVFYVLARLFNGTTGFPAEPKEWLVIAGFGALQALVYILVYKGFSKGKLAILNPIFSSYAGLAALLSIIAFHETIGLNICIALLLLFIGILLISLDFSDMGLRKIKFANHVGSTEIIAATILAAIWTIYWAHFISGKDWKIYASLMYLFMSLTVYLYSLKKHTDLKIKDSSIWKFLVGIGLGEIIAYVSISYGFSETSHTSIIALLSGAFSLPVIILSYFFLKERIDRLHRIGSLVIILGIAIISLA